jgi:hypothetical protein
MAVGAGGLKTMFGREVFDYAVAPRKQRLPRRDVVGSTSTFVGDKGEASGGGERLLLKEPIDAELNGHCGSLSGSLRCGLGASCGAPELFC